MVRVLHCLLTSNINVSDCVIFCGEDLNGSLHRERNLNTIGIGENSQIVAKTRGFYDA